MNTVVFSNEGCSTFTTMSSRTLLSDLVFPLVSLTKICSIGHKYNLPGNTNIKTAARLPRMSMTEPMSGLSIAKISVRMNQMVAMVTRRRCSVTATSLSLLCNKFDHRLLTASLKIKTQSCISPRLSEESLPALPHPLLCSTACYHLVLHKVIENKVDVNSEENHLM